MMVVDKKDGAQSGTLVYLPYFRENGHRKDNIQWKAAAVWEKESDWSSQITNGLQPKPADEL